MPNLCQKVKPKRDGARLDRKYVTMSCCALICAKAWKQTTINTHLMVKDNIQRDVSAWLTVRNVGVRTGGNTQCQDGKHKESEDNQGSQSGNSCTMWKGEPGSQGEGGTTLGRRTYSPNTILGHELSTNMGLCNLGEFFEGKTQCGIPRPLGCSEAVRLWSSLKLHTWYCITGLIKGLSLSLSLITPLLKAH